MAIQGNSGELIIESNPRKINGQWVYGAMPQHVQPGTEAPELTEGTDGAIHTKILDHTGAPIFTDSNPAKFQLTGSLMEHAGNTLSEAPVPSTVPVGSEYTDIENEIIYKNTGSEWKEWVVL